MVRRVAAAVLPPKKPKHKESDSGKAAIAPRRRLSPFAFAAAAKATAIPLFVQRLMRFFAAASYGTEAMQTDARYRDTLGTAAIAPEYNADFDCAAARPDFVSTVTPLPSTCETC